MYILVISLLHVPCHVCHVYCILYTCMWYALHTYVQYMIHTYLNM